MTIIPELLAPAGNMEKLKMALLYGADAVYLGGKAFGLRAFSDNFSNEEMLEAIEFTHKMHKKLYVTVNIFPHNEDLAELPAYIKFLADSHVDGVLIADVGIYRIIRETAPQLPIHISTQANNTNWSSVLFWQDAGVKRVVLAREVSIKEIAEIRSRTNIELEAFVHGATCMSYSGRCLLSSYLTGRDANRGECAQACRWKYHLVEETRPGEYMPVVEDERGTYIFNTKDLCMLEYLPQLAAAGLNSLKIEGRMKSVHYVSTVVKVYREALDSYKNNPDGFQVREEWWHELNKISHREYSTGFYFNKPDAGGQIYTGSTYSQTHDFIGLIREYDPVTGMATVEQRNNMKVGDAVEIMQPPEGENFLQTISAMFDDEMNPITVAPHPQQIIYIPLAKPVLPYSIIRRKVTTNE